jgi:hypothetical protein
MEKGWHRDFPSFKKKGIAQASLLHEVEKVAEGRMRSFAKARP